MNHKDESKAHFLPIILLSLTATACSSLDQEKNYQATVCANQGAVTVVKLKPRKLYLCKNNNIVSEYSISIGQNGYPKTTQGDKKTPIGIYDLGKPRASEEFGTFIPVIYPNPEDIKKGYTGEDIGIHGPKRGYAWLGFLNTSIDWTLGCMAVKSDKQIKSIAKWVEEENIKNVKILE